MNCILNLCPTNGSSLTILGATRFVMPTCLLLGRLICVTLSLFLQCLQLSPSIVTDFAPCDRLVLVLTGTELGPSAACDLRDSKTRASELGWLRRTRLCIQVQLGLSLYRRLMHLVEIRVNRA